MYVGYVDLGWSLYLVTGILYKHTPRPLSFKLIFIGDEFGWSWLQDQLFLPTNSYMDDGLAESNDSHIFGNNEMNKLDVDEHANNFVKDWASIWKFNFHWSCLLPTQGAHIHKKFQVSNNHQCLLYTFKKVPIANLDGSNFQHYLFKELTQEYCCTVYMVPLYFEVATPVMPYTLLVKRINVLNSNIKCQSISYSHKYYLQNSMFSQKACETLADLINGRQGGKLQFFRDFPQHGLYAVDILIAKREHEVQLFVKDQRNWHLYSPIPHMYKNITTYYTLVIWYFICS